MLIISDEFRQNGLKYNHLKTEILPHNPLYLSPGSIRLKPDTNQSDLIATVSAFNYLYLDHSLSDRAEMYQ